MEVYKKGDATSPTVHSKSVFITVAINAHEDRDVGVRENEQGALRATKISTGLLPQTLRQLGGKGI